MEKNRKKVIAKLSKLAKGNKSQWLADATWRKENRGWLKKSQAIALKMLRKLRENKQLGVTPCTQVELANALGVKPQQVNKLVKGKENFTLDTISKIENVLHIDLLHVEKPQINKSTTHKSLIEHLNYAKRLQSAIYDRRTRKKKTNVIHLHKEVKKVTKIEKYA